MATSVAMKAMRLHKPGPVKDGPLRIERVADPRPGPKELLVRVHVCGVCRTDLHQVEGDLPMQRSPVIPGHQIVGSVAARGAEVDRWGVGDRVAAAWLHDACGQCAFCTAGGDRKENLCTGARFTGWSVDGGYAEYMTVPAAFALPVPHGFSDEQAAPLLCAGIIGYRAFCASGVRAGERLGLYGFGGSAHITIQVARHSGCEVFVFTRRETNRELARSLGAAWVGGSQDRPPGKLHGSIIFAPAGPLVPDALGILEKGGTVVLAGIHMSAIPALDYRQHLYDEKVLRSVANATRRDGRELLAIAAEVPIRTSTTRYPLAEANEALRALKTGRICGSAVLSCTDAP